MLPIRQTLNALPALNRTAKAVLIEVCELAEHGTHGCCTAKNEYLVSRLGGTERTISRTLTMLEQRGLLLSQGQGKARRLSPSATLRACYASSDEAARHAAATRLNLVTEGSLDAPNLDTLDTNLDIQPSQSVQVEAVDNLDNLDKMGTEPRQNGSVNLDKTGAEPRQNGSRVLGDDQYDQVDDQEALSSQERARLKKKIGELEMENVRLRSLLAARTPAPTPPVARPPHSPEARRAGTYRDYDAEGWPEQLHPPFETPAFHAAWAKWGKYLVEIGKPHRGLISEDENLLELRQLADGSHELALTIISKSISIGWKSLNLPTHAINRRPQAPFGSAATGGADPNARLHLPAQVDFAEDAA